MNGRAGTKMALVILGILAIQKRSKAKKAMKKRKRTMWTKPWLRDRARYSDMGLVRHLQEESPDGFRNYLRMSDSSFQLLLDKVTPLIQKQDTILRQAIPAEQRLIATLRYLATGRSMEDLKFSCGIAAPTLGRIIPETCAAIITALSPEYLKMPSTMEEWKTSGEHFDSLWQFPNCGGAIDGKHVRIQPPAHSGSYYYNYKGYFSVVLLAIVNAHYEFIFVDVGKNGRNSDGGVIERTKFALQLKNGQLNLPPNSDTKEHLNFVFLADDAFALGEHVLNPFPQKDLSREKRVFNYRLSRARRVVENAFGIMANRFRIFHTTINLSVAKIDLVVHACCVLHNFLRRTTATYCPTVPGDSAECTAGSMDQHDLANLEPGRPHLVTSSARDNRQKYMDYFMGDGAVQWQEEHLLG